MLVFLLFFHISGLTAQNKSVMSNQQYLSDWKKVAEYERKSLPQSAAKEVDKILHRAVNEQNTPETIKAIIHLGK